MDSKIKNMLENATLVFVDMDTLHIELEGIYASSLTTSDMKYKALGFAMEDVEKLEAEFKKEKNQYTHRAFQIREDIRELCETMLIIAIALNEPEDAVKYYWLHNRDSDKEVTLFRILDTVELFGDEKVWTWVYEDGLKRRVMPRESLQKKYQNLKKG